MLVVYLYCDIVCVGSACELPHKSVQINDVSIFTYLPQKAHRLSNKFNHKTLSVFMCANAVSLDLVSLERVK